MIGIYQILNATNGKRYIGQSINIESRLSHHKEMLINNQHFNKHLQNSFNKYGLENFTFEVLEECNKEELSTRERYYIKLYNSMNEGYNKTSGGENIPGWQQSDEVRHKISEKLKVNNAMHRSEIAKKANSDRIWSDESRKKLSDSTKKRFAENPEQGLKHSQYLSESNRQRTWVNDGVNNKFVLKSELQYYLSIGFVKGRIMPKNCINNKYSDSRKRVMPA